MLLSSCYCNKTIDTTLQ
uniref:Uncharacterized protein n=1 Tax=Anguilla anguilla TaxID=7936 RepID=A0A0E9RI91_ANGAN